MKMALTVQGINDTYTFIVDENPKNLKGWQEDGLKIDEIIATIPEWWIEDGHTIQEWLDRNN